MVSGLNARYPPIWWVQPIPSYPAVNQLHGCDQG